MSSMPSLPDYKQVFRCLPGQHLLLTPEGQVVDCSLGFSAATHHSRPELVGNSCTMAWPVPTQAAQVAAVLARVRQTRQLEVALLVAPDSAAALPLRLMHTPLLNARGELIYILQTIDNVAAPDTTATSTTTAPATPARSAAPEPALHQALAEADTQRGRLYHLLMQVPAAIASLNGPEHVFSLVNPGYQQLVGERPLLGKPIREGLPELEGQIFFELLDQVYRTGTTYYGNEMAAHMDRTNTGTLVPYYFNFIYQAIRNATQEVEGVLIFASDVTEQVLSRRKVEQSEVQLQQANEELATLNEELHASNEEFHASNAELFSTQQELRSLNQELEERVRQRTKAQEQAQLDAEQQRARLERFFMQAPAAICILTGPDLVFELVNPGYQQLFPGRELAGKPLLHALPELAGQPMWQTLRQVYQTGITHEERGLLTPVARTEGGPLEAVYLDYIQQARFDSQGVIDGIMVFAYEVTDQVQARQLAQQAARAFETLTDAIPHLVWTATPTGYVDYYNEQWHAYTGRTPTQLEGQGWTAVISPDDLPNVTKHWNTALLTGQPYQMEARLRNAAGAFRWFLIRAQPFHDDQGRIIRWFGANTDIHEQKRVEQTLLESEAHFRVMADNVPVMIWVTRPDAECVYLNQQWYDYTGQSEEQGLGFGWVRAVHPEETSQATVKFHEANARREPYHAVFRLKTQAGLYRWVVDTGMPKFNAEGEFEGYVGSVVDIHERKTAEQALRLASQKLAVSNKELRAAHQQSQQANAELAATNEQLTRINQDLDNFVYTASHDLRQPVNNLAGVFEELKRSATFHDPEAEQLVQMFEGALHQIHSTIQGLAEVVHVERRNEQLPPEPVALLPLTQGVIQSMKNQVDAAQADFELDFSALPTIRFARLNLQSILYNLLSNALKYAHPDRAPHVRIATELAPDNTPVLLVQDNGLGLDLARYGPDLFKMFRRFHDHVPGSGMGLYLVNRIVRQAGGRLAVESTVGTGTTFRIYLPVSDFAE